MYLLTCFFFSLLTLGLDIEGLFRLSGGNPKLVEQLKIWIDRTGDVCLEACGDITSVACLLKVWLRDLPEPLVPPETTADLVRQYYSKFLSFLTNRIAHTITPE